MSEDVGSWKGSKMMNPDGKIGTVIDDNNIGFIRVLTVKFEDETIEKLTLSNVGENPKESQNWKWLYKNEKGKEEWVNWGY